MKLRPLHDHVVVELEPLKEFTRGGIVKVGPEPVRVGRVKAVGKGRQYMDRYIPMELKVGDRIAFFKAATETQQGQQVSRTLPDDYELVRETDALFVLPDDLDMEITR